MNVIPIFLTLIRQIKGWIEKGQRIQNRLWKIIRKKLQFFTVRSCIQWTVIDYDWFLLYSCFFFSLSVFVGRSIPLICARPTNYSHNTIGPKFHLLAMISLQSNQHFISFYEPNFYDVTTFIIIYQNCM